MAKKKGDRSPQRKRLWPEVDQDSFALGYQRGVRSLRAKYDIANPFDSDNDEHWLRGVDSLSADAANNPAVRKRVRERARYETDNNGYLSGIVDTLVNDLVGTGPMVQLSSNRDIPESIAKQAEADWNDWRRGDVEESLQVMARAKIIDGEAFCLLVNNPAQHSAVKLSLVPVECEQITDPAASNDPFNIDGIKLDRNGNVVSYVMLRDHPGGIGPGSLEANDIPANRMIHWFKRRRPGQHRGISDLIACLKASPMLRRYSLATLRAAEIQAANGGVLEAEMEQGAFDTSVMPEDTIHYERGMITALPPGYKFRGFDPTQPSANMDMFVRTILQEIGRPLNVPLVVILMNASGFNFASGRLDHLVYWKAIKNERAKFANRVVRPLFDAWWYEWRRVRHLSHLPGVVPEFIFPGFEFLDILKETNAHIAMIDNGMGTLEDYWVMTGRDPELMRRKVEADVAWRRKVGVSVKETAEQITVEEQEEDDGEGTRQRTEVA